MNLQLQKDGRKEINHAALPQDRLAVFSLVYFFSSEPEVPSHTESSVIQQSRALDEMNHNELTSEMLS